MNPFENPAVYILLLTGTSLIIKLIFILRCYCNKEKIEGKGDDDSDLV